MERSCSEMLLDHAPFTSIPIALPHKSDIYSVIKDKPLRSLYIMGLEGERDASVVRKCMFIHLFIAIKMTQL